MKFAEDVTFGGSNLERAAHLRNPQDQEKLQRSATARTCLFWRGKPCLVGAERGPAALAQVELTHSVLADQKEDLMFLGVSEDGAPYFAADISGWVPDEVPESLNAFLDSSAQHHPALPKDHAFVELRQNMTRLSPRDAELAASARGVFEWHRFHAFCSKCGEISHVAKAGWQRTCGSCGRHHFPRTDPVVIMLVTHGNSVLLGRSPGWPQGMYSCLAGFMEPGETMEAAVRREVFEETGVKVGQVDYLASQPWPFPASLMMGCHGHATSTEIKIDPEEIEDAIWMTKEEMVEVFEGRNSAVLPARKGAIAHFLLTRWLADRLD